MSYEKVYDADELWDGEMVGVRTKANQAILLINVEGHIYAYEDRCPHQAVPLSKGRLRDRILRCHAHHWEFDVVTGLAVNPRGSCLRRVPVRQCGRDLLVDAEAMVAPRETSVPDAQATGMDSGHTGSAS